MPFCDSEKNVPTKTSTLQAEISRLKKRLAKATQNETVIEKHLLNSEKEVEQLRGKITASPSEHNFLALKNSFDANNALLDLRSQELLRSQHEAQTAKSLLHQSKSEIERRESLLRVAHDRLLQSDKIMAENEAHASDFVSRSKDDSRNLEILLQEKESLFEQNAQYSSEISAIQKQRDRLSSLLEERSSELAKRPQLQEFHSLKESLRQNGLELDDERDHVRLYREELKALENKKEEHLLEVKKQGDRIVHLQQQLSEALEQISATNASYESKTQGLDAQRYELEEELGKVRFLHSKCPEEKEYQLLKSHLEERESHLETTNSELCKLRRDFEHAKQTNATEMEENGALLANATEHLSASRAEIASLKLSHESSAEKLRNERNMMHSRVDEMKLLLEDRPTKQDQQIVKSAFEEKETALKEAIGQLRYAREEAQLMKKQSQVQQSDIQNKTSLLIEAKEQLLEFGEKLSNTESLSKSDRHVFEATIAEKEVNLAENTFRLDEMRKSAQETMTEMEAERTRLQNGFQQLKENAAHECREMEECKENLTADRDALKQDLSDKESEVESLQKQIELTKSTIDSKDSILASIAEQRDSLSEQVLQLSRKNSTLEHAIHKSDDLISNTHSTSEQLVRHQTASHKAALLKLELELNDSESLKAAALCCMERILVRLQNIVGSSAIVDNTDAESRTMGNDSLNHMQAAANSTIVSLEERIQKMSYLETELEDLSDKQKHHLKQISNLESEKMDLIAASTMAQDEIVGMRGKIDSLVVVEKEMESALERYKTVAMETENRLHEHEVAAEVATTSLTQELSISEGENDNLLVKNKNLENRIMELRQTLVNKGNVEELLSSLRQTHEDELESLNNQLELLACHKKKSDEQLDLVSVKNREAQKLLGTMSKAVTNLKVEYSSSETQRKSLAIEYSELQQESNKLLDKSQKAMEENSSLSEKLSTLNETCKSHVHELHVLRDNLRQVMKTKAHLQDHLRECEDALQIAQTSLTETNENLMQGETKCQELQKSLQSTSDRNISLEDLTCELKSEVETLRGSVTVLTEAQRVLEENNQSKQRELTDILTARSDVEQKSSKLEADIKNAALVFKEKLNAMEIEMEAKRSSEIKKVQDEFKENFRRASVEAEETQNSLKSQISTLEEERRKRSANVIDSQNEMNRDLANKEAELREAQRKLEAAVEAQNFTLNLKEELESELTKEREQLGDMLLKSEEVTTQLREKKEEVQCLNEKVGRSEVSIRKLEDRVAEADSSRSECETELRNELCTLSEKLKCSEVKSDELERSLNNTEDLSSKRLSEIGRLNNSTIPEIKKHAESAEKEIQHLGELLQRKSEEWSSENKAVSMRNESISQQLEEVTRNLDKSKTCMGTQETSMRKICNELKEKNMTCEELERECEQKITEVVRLKQQWEELEKTCCVQKHRTQEVESILEMKEEDMSKLEEDLAQRQLENSQSQSKMEELLEKVMELEASQAEYCELQKSYMKLRNTAGKMKRRATRAETVLKLERKKHSAKSERKEVSLKREVSPSVKGLSPALKRVRDEQIRQALSPACLNRPPRIPTRQVAKRSLDFGG